MQQARWARPTRSSAHPQYLALHAEDTARQRLYPDWVQAAVTPEDVDEIRHRLQCQHALGTERFRQMIEEQLQRRTGPAKIGRPRKSAHQAYAHALCPGFGQQHLPGTDDAGSTTATPQHDPRRRFTRYRISCGSRLSCQTRVISITSPLRRYTTR